MPDGKTSGAVAQPWLWILTAFWLCGVFAGLWIVWAYDNAAGAEASAPVSWPAGSALVPASDRPTLLFLAHPHCTCTRASLTQLEEVLAQTTRPAEAGRYLNPKTYVLFLRPSGFDTGWEETDLWRRAAALPNVIVVRDDDGAEARRFGVETSGQTLLYDKRGTLIFSGGITASRGHVGDSAGEAALVSLLTSGNAERDETNVFGCALFARGENEMTGAQAP